MEPGHWNRAARRGVQWLSSTPSMTMPILRDTRSVAAFLGAIVLLATRVAAAQSGYYNLDSGRPTRIEDAVATPRGELEMQLLPLRVEWVGDGTQRLRFEPKLAYGVLPLTEIELRIPLVDVRAPTSGSAIGIASAGLGALHAFNAETSWPALALAAEVVLPVGSLSAPTPSYSVKALMSKTFPFARFELNVGGGTWSVRTSPASPVPAGYTCGNAPGVPPCLIPDVPCDVVPSELRAGPSFACAPAASLSATSTTASSGSRSTGPHWTAALGIDHTLPLVSTLLTANVIVDRFEGLYPLSDWTAEIGLRRQVAPQLVFDLGVGRRFAGTTQSTSVTAGLSYSTPLHR
jgi:hypothetical protein